jgi:hypothetical protein
MKRIFLLVALSSFIAFSAFSQGIEAKQKKDVKELLPKAGDFALVIDAGPFLDYAADLVSFDGGVPAISPDFQSFRQDIMGKYFLENDFAIRGRLTVGTNNFNRYYYIDDDVQVLAGDPNAKTVDVWKQRESVYELGGGVEKRIGQARVQGYVGAEVFIGFSNEKNTYQYGNPITDVNTWPSATPMNGGINLAAPERTLYTKTIGGPGKPGNNFEYGLRGIVGVDFFITKNIAIGGEIALEARGLNGAKQKAIVEFWDVNQVTTKEVLVSPGNTALTIANVPVTSLSVSFFF